MSAPFIFDVTEKDFAEKVLESSRQRPVLVDFWADWCPPCRALTPVLEKFARDSGGAVRLAKVEVDDNSAGSGIGRASARPQGEPQDVARQNMRLAGRYRLRGFPTVILFIQGEEAGRFSGARGEQQVRDFISGHVPDDSSAAVNS